MTVHAFLRVLLFFCALGLNLSAESRLYVAWTDFDTCAASYLERGMTREQVLEDALVLLSGDELGDKAARVFIELFDSVFGYMRRNSEFQPSEKIAEIKQFVFKVLNKHNMIRQKFALEVFKEYKKWNLKISDHGTVAFVDKYLVMDFIKTLPTFFDGVSNKGTRFVKLEELSLFTQKVADVAPYFTMSKPHALFRAASSYAQTVAAHAGVVVSSGVSVGVDSAEKGLQVGHAVVSRGMAAMNHVSERFSMDKAIRYAGSLSALGLFLGSLYVAHNRKEIARKLIVNTGGKGEAIKKIVSLYAQPKQRLEKIKGMVRAWAYDDIEYRANRAQEIAGFAKTAHASDKHKTDPLTAVLLHFARNPEAVDPEHAEEIAKEMANDVAFAKYKKDKASGELLSIAGIRKAFTEAALKYRKNLGDKKWFSSTPRLEVNADLEFARQHLILTVKSQLNSLQKELGLSERKYKFATFKKQLNSNNDINKICGLSDELKKCQNECDQSTKKILFDQFALHYMGYTSGSGRVKTVSAPAATTESWSSWAKRMILFRRQSAPVVMGIAAQTPTAPPAQP
jgi:hypothetical protein